MTIVGQDVHPDLKVTISMGLCNDVSLASAEMMLNAANDHLYEAKNKGRNRNMPAIRPAFYSPKPP